jgi:thioredoxin reductase
MQELLFTTILCLLVVAWKNRRRVRQDRFNQAILRQNERDHVQPPPSLHPFIDTDRCMGCGSCMLVCPEANVLGLVKMKAAVLQPDHCVGHGKCEAACPVGAITLVLGTSDNGVEIPVTDEDFQTRVPGVYIAGELGGIGLIRNAMMQGMQCIEFIAGKLNGNHDVFDNHEVYDVVIVGAGPAGLGATLQADARDLRYLTLEQDDIGGAILKYPRRKVVMTAPLHLPGYGKIYFRDVLKEELLLEWKKIIKKTGIKIHTKTRVEKILPAGSIIEVVAGGKRSATRNVVLALGRRGTPRKLGVPGEHLPKVIYQLDDPYDYVGRNCLVIGGGDSALECALMLAEAGARVALSYRQNHITRAKARNRQLIEEAIKKRKIQAFMPSAVKEITEDRVWLEMNDEEKSLPNDDVIIMAGGVMPFEFLKELGVEMRTLYGEPIPSRKAA